ncbi:MAG: GNAT family N-acetyltransferase [Neisseriaceae bacterium]|nr:GNAT family N-acetyltransferase [Neisseriaceae bacterium]
MNWPHWSEYCDLRLAQRADLPSIVDIYNSTIPSREVTAALEPVSVEERESWFFAHDERHPIWVLSNPKNDILAWVSIEPFFNGRAAYAATAEVSIYLAANQRGQGLGKKLLQQVLLICPDLGITRLMAAIFTHNKASITLFQKAGFQQWGICPDVGLLDGRAASLALLGKVIE